MKPIRSGSLWRGCILPILALASICWLVPGEAATQQPQPPKEAPRPVTSTTVFKPKYMKARDLARIIQEILAVQTPGHELRVSVDDRYNALFVAATPDEMVSVERLITATDVAQSKSEPTVRTVVFQLEHTRADVYLQQALNLVGGGVTVDPQRNVVIVSGDGKTLDAAASLLQLLDKPQGRRAVEESMQVRVVWLASGMNRKEAPKLPEDMKGVVAELAKMGVEEPRLVTQTLVTALPNTEFRVEGLAGLDSPPYRLSVSGRLSGRPGETRLHISINATQLTPNAPPSVVNPIGRLDTEIEAPLGHAVVLGMTPTATSTSVFVVQILPKR